ncbi:MAG: cytidylyltransferase [Elusimicrobiota bacterium]
MIPALLIGREGSLGFPGKNAAPLMGRPLMTYPLLASLNSKYVDEVYVSTDSAKVKEIAAKHGAAVIDRPEYLCTKEALGEDVFVHGYKHIKDVLKKDIEIILLLHCNGICVLPSQIDHAVETLRKYPDYDSAVTVAEFNMYSPLRARSIGDDGLLHPFIPFENYPKNMKINCNRDAQGSVYFADVCLSAVRPRCLDDLEKGVLPQRWMGQKIYPIIQSGSFDIDFEWQMPLLEHWLKGNGFTASNLPYEVIHGKSKTKR